MIARLIAVATAALMLQGANALENNAPLALAIHGGAGTILKSNISPELEQQYHAKLTEALQAGHKKLQAGDSALSAVQAAIVVMEDSPLFNAGKGAVFTHAGRNEMDASIMRGSDLNAGAVAGVSTIRNPILAAAAVLEKSNHVMLSGAGAEAFASAEGLEMVDPKYFYTERRWQQLQKVLKEKPDASVLSEDKSDPSTAAFPDDKKFGTVGAVALDKFGNLAAGTSTGGMTNKKYGRIGDSPIIGAGTYADNRACAISATGHGEYFIRAAVAHDICARVLYQDLTLQAAADAVIQDKLVKMGGDGGIIGLSPSGEVVFSFNSKGMYRGAINTKGEIMTAIYKD
ncbi:MAG: beta-aspartyl-peptidase [Gammaproteobacteria bacterium]|nr:MAG: beta-aspartyl-peptidase [Gammaproteobacteria bacterium]